MTYKKRTDTRFNIFIGLSVLIMVIGLLGIPKIWISERNLITTTGRLDSAKSTVHWEFQKSHRQPNQIDKFKISELFFRLKDRRQDYILIEGIGDHFINEQFESILKGLKSADTITVWTALEDKQLSNPKIYRIDCDTNTVLEFHPLHLENSFTTPILLFFGTLFLIIGILKRKRPEST